MSPTAGAARLRAALDLLASYLQNNMSGTPGPQWAVYNAAMDALAAPQPDRELEFWKGVASAAQLELAQMRKAALSPIETTAGVPISDERLDAIRRQVWEENRNAGVEAFYRLAMRAAILAASPVQKAEPAKWFREYDANGRIVPEEVCRVHRTLTGVNVIWTGTPPPDGTKLYATPTGDTSEREADRG